MKFENGKMYLCTHDVLITKELAFKSSNIYKCVKENTLKELNEKEYDLSKFHTKWEYYFREPEIKSTMRQFKEIVNKMIHLYETKNQDYGNSFEQSCNEFGITAGLVRLNDKFNRIKSLSKKENLVKDESIEDTLIDLANYAIMTLIWYKNSKDK